MNRRQFITGSSVTAALWFLGCTKTPKTPAPGTPVTSAHQDTEGYWTCTMHPQIHLAEPGKCPICGMPLVYVDKHSKPEEPRTESIQTSEEQLKNAQISKYTVVRQDLEIAISASGRLLSSRQVSFQIYESDLPSVKPGSLFTGVPSVFSGQSFKGKITRVDTLVDPSSRTVRVEGTLDRPLTGVTSESGFQGEISNTLKNQIVVPESAVLHAGARELVYVFSAGNKLEPREVALGQKGQSQYQILSGLQAGEIISSGPNFLIDSEAKLRGQ